jgi:predicted nucleic acid-binding Zn ribbon protein
MNNASNLIWKTKLRIYRIKDEEVKRINRVKSFKPSIMAEECEDKGIPLTEEAWNQACINALIEGEKPQDRRKEMPFYEYECPVCKAILETVLPCPAPDNLKRKCYFCEEVREYKRIMSAPAIVKVK